MDENTRSGNSGGRFLSSKEANPWIRVINAFLYSPWFMIWVAVLTLLANIFGKEMIAYSCIIITAIYIILFCRDLLPLMPFFICGYISPSLQNNPGRNPDSIFYPANGGLILLGMLVLVFLAMIVRLSMDKSLRRKLFTTPRRLWLGLALLGVAYLMSGIGCEQYEGVWKRNLLFAAVQFASVAGLCWLFSGAVYWEKTPRNFFAWMGTMVGVVLLLELGYIYLTGDIVVEGVIHRYEIFTGWGISNNIGSLLAMMIPFPYFFASQAKKNAWGYHLLGVLMLIGVVFTNSRGSILVTAFLLILCAVAVLWKTKRRFHNGMTYCITILLAMGIAWCKRDGIAQFFQETINLGLSSSGRVEIYQEGWNQFVQNPILGASFFSVSPDWSWADQDLFISFFPARWHNTLMQIAASCGVVGLIAYAVHRVQTVMLFFKKENRVPFKIFIGLSIFVLLATSLVDCHFFNVGPAFFYSMALAFVEHCPSDNP